MCCFDAGPHSSHADKIVSGSGSSSADGEIWTPLGLISRTITVWGGPPRHNTGWGERHDGRKRRERRK